jgi:hypothetical protein
MSRPVVYTCVTGGYDCVAPVDEAWDCDFVLLHDGSVAVPRGWTGRRLSNEPAAGRNLNRYTKMLPHRLGLASRRSMYVDGNVRLLRDPRPKIDAVTERHALAAFAHPARDCAYRELRELLRLGFVPPGAVWREWRRLRAMRMPPRSGLYEAGVLIRRHDEAAVVAFGEAWWTSWNGGLGRDQPLMAAALWSTDMAIGVLGPDLRADPDGVIALDAHEHRRTRQARIPNRLMSELALFRAWLPK